MSKPTYVRGSTARSLRIAASRRRGYPQRQPTAPMPWRPPVHRCGRERRPSRAASSACHQEPERPRAPLVRRVSDREPSWLPLVFRDRQASSSSASGAGYHKRSASAFDLNSACSAAICSAFSHLPRYHRHPSFCQAALLFGSSRVTAVKCAIDSAFRPCCSHQRASFHCEATVSLASARRLSYSASKARRSEFAFS